MSKKSNRNTFRKAKATGIAAAVFASAIVPSIVVGLDTVNAAEKTVDSVTRSIYETSNYSIAYETDGVTVKLLSVIQTKTDTLVLPDTIDGLPVTEIGGYFTANNPTILTSLTLPSSIKVIGEFAFSSSKLTSLALPTGLKELRNYAFNSSLLTSLTIPSSVEYIGAYVFSSSPLTSLSFENDSMLKTIDKYAFWHAQLTSLELPDSVTKIGTNAFNLSPLTTLKLPSNLKKIGYAAFEKAKLSELSVPKNLREIGESTFLNSTFTLDSLTGFENIIGLGAIPPGRALGINTDKFKDVIEAAFSTYNGDNYTMTYKEIDGVIHLIKLKTFTGGSELILPNSIDGKPVTRITSEFGKVLSLNLLPVSKLVLPDKLESIGDSAFHSFKSVTEMNFPSTLTDLDETCFAEIKLTKLSLPEGIESIPTGAFRASPLVELKLPSTLKEIGMSAFMDASLTSVEIPNGVTIIRDNAFYSSPLTTLKLPSSLELISWMAFYNSVLTELYLPKSVMQVGYKAFAKSNINKLVVNNNYVAYNTSTMDVLNNFGLSTDAIIYTDLGSSTRNLTNINNYTLRPLNELAPPTPILTKEEGAGSSKVFINTDEDVDHYEYSLDAGDTWTQTTDREIVVTESATVQVRAYDSAGKVSPTASIEVNVAPKTDLNIKKPMPTEITVNKGDALSINYADYFEGDGLTVTTTLKSETNYDLVFTGFNSMKDGKYTLSYTVSDAYGNEETGTYNAVYLTDVQASMSDFSLYSKQGETVSFDVAPLLKMPSYSEQSYEVKTLSGGVGSTVTFTDGKLNVEGVSEGTSVYYLTVKNQYNQEVNFTVNVHAVASSNGGNGVVTNPSKNDAHTLNMFVDKDETQTIPLDALVSDLDGELTYELTDTPAGVVDATVNGSSLTVKGLSKGYTTLNIKATDVDGDKVSLMVLVYVGNAQNSSTGGSTTIDDATIKANVGYYVVPMGEVFGDLDSSSLRQYNIEVTKKGKVASSPLVKVRFARTASTPIVPPTDGVANEIVYHDGSLQVDLVNDVLLIAGYNSSEYSVAVTALTDTGVSAPKEFSVKVESDSTDNGSGGGSNGGSGSGDGGSGNDNGNGNGGGTGSGDGGTTTPPNGGDNNGTGGGNGSDNGNGSETTPPTGDLVQGEEGDLIISVKPGKPSTSDTVDIVVDEDSMQIGIGDKTYDSTISNGLASYAKKRVIRDEGNGVYTTVPHFVEDTKLHIKTKNPTGLVITSRVTSNFKDTKGLFSENEVEDLYNYLIVQGTTATTYSPNKNITRGQFSTMIARALELKPKGDKYTFDDASKAWYKDSVQALYEAGIITGFPDGTFGGDKSLSRQQAAAMIERMLKYMDVDTTPTAKVELEDMDRISDYAKSAVQYLASNDVLNNGKNTNFNPFNNLTRAQMAKVLMRSLQLSDWY